MTIEAEILKALIEHDHFNDEGSMAEGIARRAIDKGYDSLTAKQQAVLDPHLKMSCPGVSDPGENHNECPRLIDGAELLSAIQASSYYGEILCEHCREESDAYTAHWQRIQAE